jgi:hypothetical protein
MAEILDNKEVVETLLLGFGGKEIKNNLESAATIAGQAFSKEVGKNLADGLKPDLKKKLVESIIFLGVSKGSEVLLGLIASVFTAGKNNGANDKMLVQYQSKLLDIIYNARALEIYSICNALIEYNPKTRFFKRLITTGTAIGLTYLAIKKASEYIAIQSAKEFTKNSISKVLLD